MRSDILQGRIHEIDTMLESEDTHSDAKPARDRLLKDYILGLSQIGVDGISEIARDIVKLNRRIDGSVEDNG